ncbi:hypothetical protein B0T18DRAFT_320465 [Schizothecium vesticola]|uniref:NADH-ubiquinone oxidoreductase 17.8 kDa subunit n=1 Tax=Schizothecium vesticola TaxID=314040 RepID=A0AA40F5E8_9PEZI|nr:hypothetical protein B0T18DRAFT_320465 [Schizothecium vesticola]
MSAALRTQAVRAARQIRPAQVRNTRSYASDHGHGHHAHGVEESLGMGFWIAVGSIPASVLVYMVSRPDKNGEKTVIEKWIGQAMDMQTEMATKNHNNAAAIEQAAKDRHLFYHVPRQRHIELKYPETFGHGSPYNVPAGHSVNMDKVVAHYHQKHLDAEERKAKKLAAAAE